MDTNSFLNFCNFCWRNLVKLFSSWRNVISAPIHPLSADGCSIFMQTSRPRRRKRCVNSDCLGSGGGGGLQGLFCLRIQMWHASQFENSPQIEKKIDDPFFVLARSLSEVERNLNWKCCTVYFRKIGKGGRGRVSHIIFLKGFRPRHTHPAWKTRASLGPNGAKPS